jgi:hypothetical protein
MEPNELLPIYRICVAGQLDERWLRWFDGLAVVQQPNGQTIIGGALDQAALHGILNRIRDLGLELISVQRCSSQDDLQKPG